MIKGGLGKGLGSLIPQNNNYTSSQVLGDQAVPDPETTILMVPIENIVPNRLQPRKVFDHSDLEDLVESIKIHGVLQPLLVSDLPNGNYELITGERRLRASQIAGLTDVPVMIKNTDDQTRLELALIENLQRQDLNPIEEAEGYQRLIEDFGLRQDEVAKKVGKQRPTVANILRLLDLPEAVKKALVDKKITQGHAKLILAEPTEKSRLSLLNKILQFNYSVRDTEGAVKSVQIKTHQRSLKTNTEVLALEEVLQSKLGTRVKIKSEPSGAGIIEITFYSPEELKHLIRNLGAEIEE